MNERPRGRREKVYEIPITDPGAPPFGLPGMGGAMPPQRGEVPPGVPDAPRVDFSQLPPPGSAAPVPPPAAPVPPSAAAPVPPVAAAPVPPVAVAAAPVPPPAAAPVPPPAAAPVPPPAAAFPTTQTAPPPAPAASPFTGESAIPGFVPAPKAERVIPGGPIVIDEPVQVSGFIDPDVALASTRNPGAPTGADVELESVLAEHPTVDTDLLRAMVSVLQLGASDLHVSARNTPFVRVDGGLRHAPDQDVWDTEKVESALRSLMTQDQRKHFDEVLELDFAFTLSPNARFHVNYYQQRGVIGGAFRIIPTEIKRLAALGVPPHVAEFAKLPRGLVLVTGPTGSGKSTTLAALIDLVNRSRADHIVTVEDPIEFMHANQRSLVNQREVGADTHSFANALKHVLRQDPDVILIGELRDLETIQVALTAAETGHLVFATLHTQDAPQSVDRIIDVFPPHQQGQVRTQLAGTLQGIVSQTLVPKASGQGRVVATEVLVMTPAISNLIREGKTYQIASTMQAGRELGMHTMDQHLAELVNNGTITQKAALEKVHDVEGFGRLIARQESAAEASARALADTRFDLDVHAGGH